MFKYGDKFYTCFSGSGASFLGVAIYGNKDKKWWFKAIVEPLWNVGVKISNAKYWLMYRFVAKHKYHIIDSKLKPGYYDIDYVMLHGCFALLDRYIEDECGGIEAVEQWGNELIDSDKDHFMYESSARQGRKEIETAVLYRWWHETRPADLKRRNDLTHQLYRGNPFTFEKVEGSEMSRMVRRPWTDDEASLHEELNVLEEKIDREEDEMLIRLMKIRKGLWT